MRDGREQDDHLRRLGRGEGPVRPARSRHRHDTPTRLLAPLLRHRVAGRVRVRVRWCVRVRSCRAEKWVWEKVKTSGCMPQARYGHSAAYLRYDHPTLSALMRFPPKISLTPRVRVRVRVRCRVSCVR